MRCDANSSLPYNGPNSTLSDHLGNPNEHRPVGNPPLAVQQMHEPVARAEPVQPHARPGGQVIAANLVVAHREPDKGEFLHDAVDGGELERLAAKVGIAAPLRLGPGLVLALPLVAVVPNVLLGTLYVKFNLDVGLESLGVVVTRREGDVLGREDLYLELQGSAREWSGGCRAGRTPIAP